MEVRTGGVTAASCGCDRSISILSELSDVFRVETFSFATLAATFRRASGLAACLTASACGLVDPHSISTTQTLYFRSKSNDKCAVCASSCPGRETKVLAHVCKQMQEDGAPANRENTQGNSCKQTSLRV